MHLAKFLEIHLAENVQIGALTADQYRVAIRRFHAWRGKPVRTSELNAPLVVDFMRWLTDQGRSPRTANNYRQAILMLWHAAHARGQTPIPPPHRFPRLRVARRHPTAWSLDEMRALLKACDRARPIRGWTPRHWKALVLVIYDTSLRISALLQVPRSDVSRRGHLLCRAEFQKQDADTLHRLHPSTMRLLRALPQSGMLFPWPLHKAAIWIHFGKLLRAAGLPDTHRDKFHRIRRTSYTYIYRELGLIAATEHAGHAGDLSRYYLDTTKLSGKKPIDILPRPA